MQITLSLITYSIKKRTSKRCDGLGGGGGGGEKRRETNRQTDRQGQTESQTERQTERQKHRRTDNIDYHNNDEEDENFKIKAKTRRQRKY